MDGKEDQVLTEQMEANTKIRSVGNQNSEIIKDIELNGEKTAVIYTASDGKVTANVFFANDTFWMTQKTTAELFGVKIPAISKHLNNIYISRELNEEATISKMETVQIDRIQQNLEYDSDFDRTFAKYLKGDSEE